MSFQREMPNELVNTWKPFSWAYWAAFSKRISKHMVQRIPRSGSNSIPLALANHSLRSFFVVVVFIDKGNAEFVRKAHIFFFAQHIFFVRMDIGVVKINGVVDAAGKQGFHYFAAARGRSRNAAGLFYGRQAERGWGGRYR